jgi:hypothetical protein
MQLGRAIVGAIIGAAIGIALMVVLYLSPLKLETVFLALLVAVLTGFGVRMMVATRGHASYLRGAVTAALALGAYLLGWYIVAGYAKQTAAKAAEASRIGQMVDAGDQADDEADEADAGEAENPAESPKSATTPVRPQPLAGSGNKTNVQTDATPLEIIVLCVSALVAYELGRGTAPKAAMATGESAPPPEVPEGVHPDA